MDVLPARPPAIRSGRVRKLLVLVNLKAGTVLRHPELPSLLRRAVVGRGEVVIPQGSEELLRAVSRGRLQGVDTVAICGGDGTNLAVATALRRTYADAAWPRLILLSGGTLNTAARNFGCAMPAVQLLNSVLAAEEPEALLRPMLQVNEHTGFIFGSQMVARVLETYYSGRTSIAGAVTLTTRIVTSAALGTDFSRQLFRAEPVRLSVDDGPQASHQFTCLMASTVSNPSLGLRAMPRAGEDGGFHLIGTEQSPTRLFREAGRIFTGLPLAAMSRDVVAHHATVTYESDCRYTVDGDLFTARHIELTATPPVEILVPSTP